MRTPPGLSTLTMAYVAMAIVAATSLAGALRVAAQPTGDLHNHGNDRAGQVEQLQRMILPPTEWQMDASLSADRARALSTYPHFGGLHILTSAEVWVPNDPGVVLVVSRVVATNVSEPAIASAVLAATQEFESSVAATLDVRAEARPTGERTFVHSDTATEIRIEVTQVGLGYQGLLVIARDAQRLEAVTTECIWSNGDPAPQASAATAACRAALDSTNATIVLRKRLPIAMPTVGSVANDAAPASGTALTGHPGDSTQPAAPSMNPGPRITLSDHGKIVFPPMRLARPAPPFNWRPWLFGVGTVIVLLALFLNHRHRQRIEALDGRPIRRTRGGKPSPQSDPLASRPPTTPTDRATNAMSGADTKAPNDDAAASPEE